jgi:inward rectifier potassium channel
MKRRKPSPPHFPSKAQRFVNRNGTVNIERVGAPSSWTDFYHFLLTISWPQFLGLLGGGYLLVNSLFACLYLLQPGSIANAEPGSFTDAFFFSIQTMGTIGYGVMSPHTFYADVLVTIETLTSLMALAIATGLMFSRFSRPTARVLFSQVAVVKPHNGIPTLMFRMVNQRRNQILEAQLRATLLVDEISAEGEFMRRFYDLQLVRSQTQVFALSWTAMHPITENSPLHGLTLEILDQTNAVLLVSLVGLDETFAQTVHARHAYNPEELLWNMQFEDIFLLKENGQRSLDYRRFHQVLPLGKKEGNSIG